MSEQTGDGELYARAVVALNERRWDDALAIARQLLSRMQDAPDVRFIAAVAAFESDDISQALEQIRQATALSPQRADYAAQRARMLMRAGRLAEALASADVAFALASDAPAVLGMVGVVFARCNEYTKALRAFEAAVAAAPQAPGYRYNLGSCLSYFGRMAEAEREYRAALALAPGYWRVHLSLAELRKRSAEDNDLPELQAALREAGGNPEAALYLNLAMAKQYEDVGNYPAAFRHYGAGKTPLKRARRYDTSRDRALFDAIQQRFGADDVPVAGFESEEPIFVVGMPRSGTTLVDRILSSHPQVHSAGELQNLPVLLKQLTGTSTPEVVDAATLTHVNGLDWRRLGREYVASTRPGTGSTPRFVDKLPHNFLYLGHIAKALPKAKIILLRRDPMDTCLGNFRQLFELATPNYDYSFDLLDIGRYYLMFDQLMRHWQTVLPGRIHEVRYEDLVRQQEPTTRAMLGFCELPWDAACLAFERNHAPVATASVAQVREPMSDRYMGRWRRYGQDMAPLAQLLGVPMPPSD